MVVVEFFKELVVGLLMGYLALTSSLAGYLESFVEHSKPVIETETPFTETPEPAEQNMLSVLPSEYERGGAIPRVLIEHSGYQHAALSSAGRVSESVVHATGSIREQIKEALVNIYCEFRTDEYIRITTGSGFFVDRKGIILTNAHVAQFLLLEGVKDEIDDTSCFIRSGDPAEPRYTAELLYISPLWISQNAHLITEEHPSGTGERDYALLYVSGTTDESPLPSTFSSLPFDTSLLSRDTTGSEVEIAGYLSDSATITPQTNVFRPVQASSTVEELYTFGSNFADVFDLSASPVGEQGASGGPVVNTNGSVIGLIVTKGDPQVGVGNGLRALSLSYVNRTIEEETGFPLSHALEGDPAFKGGIFRDALLPTLSKLLTIELE